jgi:hypothetical protein
VEGTARRFAACIGVAVLRYRLYAIDRIVSRVITYAIVTALTAGVFVGLVLLATGVLPVRHTPVAVALATLAVAARFNPPRRRVQHAVDRRFNPVQVQRRGDRRGLHYPDPADRGSRHGAGDLTDAVRGYSSLRTSRCGLPPGRPLRLAAGDGQAQRDYGPV